MRIDISLAVDGARLLLPEKRQDLLRARWLARLQQAGDRVADHGMHLIHVDRFIRAQRRPPRNSVAQYFLKAVC